MSIVVSLRDRIEVAKSAADVADLLAEGKKYQFATPKTQRTWQSAAKSRLAALKVSPAPVTKTAEAAPEVKAKKPRAKKTKE